MTPTLVKPLFPIPESVHRYFVRNHTFSCSIFQLNIEELCVSLTLECFGEDGDANEWITERARREFWKWCKFSCKSTFLGIISGRFVKKKWNGPGIKGCLKLGEKWNGAQLYIYFMIYLEFCLSPPSLPLSLPVSPLRLSTPSVSSLFQNHQQQAWGLALFSELFFYIFQHVNTKATLYL